MVRDDRGEADCNLLVFWDLDLVPAESAGAAANLAKETARARGLPPYPSGDILRMDRTQQESLPRLGNIRFLLTFQSGKNAMDLLQKSLDAYSPVPDILV